MLALGDRRPSSLESLGVHGVLIGCQGKESILSMAPSKVEDERDNIYWTFQGHF